MRVVVILILDEKAIMLLVVWFRPFESYDRIDWCHTLTPGLSHHTLPHDAPLCS